MNRTASTLFILPAIIILATSCNDKKPREMDKVWYPGCVVTDYIIEPRFTASVKNTPEQSISIAIHYSQAQTIGKREKPEAHAVYARRYGDTCYKGGQLEAVATEALAEPISIQSHKRWVKTPGDTLWYSMADSVALEWYTYWPAIRATSVDGKGTGQEARGFEKILSQVHPDSLILLPNYPNLYLYPCGNRRFSGVYRITINAGWGQPQEFTVTAE